MLIKTDKSIDVAMFRRLQKERNEMVDLITKFFSDLEPIYLRVRHDVRRAIAQSSLFIESTLHRARRVAVIRMNFHIILLREAAISLLNAELTSLDVIFDIFHIEYATVNELGICD